MMRCVLRDVTYTQGRMLVYSALLRLSLTLRGVSALMSCRPRMTHRQELHQCRLASAIGPYDSDATDDQGCQRSGAHHKKAMLHLDRESAQLTLCRLCVDLPGYVNVQFVILRMARVLLRTPIRDPGGGKENFTDVAARV